LASQRERVFEFLKLLAITHEAQPEERIINEEKHIFYNGPSPDEITLVDFAKNNGLTVSSVSDNECTVWVYPESGLFMKNKENFNNGHLGDEQEDPENSDSYDGMNSLASPSKKDLKERINYEILDFFVHKRIEFTSERKRMSIIVTDPIDGLIKVYIKGADSIIIDWLSEESKNDKRMMDKIQLFLQESSTKGFRTLLMGMKIIDENELKEFKDLLNVAERDLGA